MRYQIDGELRTPESSELSRYALSRQKLRQDREAARANWLNKRETIWYRSYVELWGFCLPIRRFARRYSFSVWYLAYIYVLYRFSLLWN
jgi:hypothetical protein